MFCRQSSSDAFEVEFSPKARQESQFVAVETKTAAHLQWVASITDGRFAFFRLFPSRQKLDIPNTALCKCSHWLTSERCHCLAAS